MIFRQKSGSLLKVALAIALFFIVSCTAGGNKEETAVSSPNNSNLPILSLPKIEAVDLENRPLNVVATTSIIGDVVAHVGGDAIQLTTLMAAGQDPHSFEPAAQDLTAVAQADLIFINGWDLEEALVEDIAEISNGAPIVPISAHIIPISAEDKDHRDSEHDHDHDHQDADPHVWLSVANVKQWVENSRSVLSLLDPNNASTYASNATAYLAELDTLEASIKTELAQILAAKRTMITNHDAFSYFATEYGFTILGTVIPGDSTLAEPSASALAELVELIEAQQICTIFVETAVNISLAQTVADEISSCDEVAIIPLYAGAIGPIGSGADSYISMIQANVQAIVEGLK